MNKLRVICTALALCSFVSCNNQAELFVDSTATTKLYGADIPEEDIIPSVLNIRISDSLAEEFESHSDSLGRVNLKGIKSIPTDGLISAERLFAPAGEFEPRTRAAGLHLWYVLKYNPEVSITKASGDLYLPGVELIEYCPKIEIVGNPTVTGYVDAMNISQTAASTRLFDDPMFPRQWHYYNDGSNAYTVSGCDINVVPVWRSYTTGNPDVIVGVVDGGVDYNHEDLSANMWHNPDKSGDFQYGYNFVKNNYKINPEDHGTHVAGTIAAVNNNGKGVCGVAGGNTKTKAKGVKIMSCQIFDGDDSGSGVSAIKWSADNGAVISQNSWGYTNATTTPSSLKAAVDYFIENAGIDANGRQTGPMKGGIVIFAAGNDNTDKSSADYDKMYSVGSVGADYRRAYYSNYGPWVDIAAPGGDTKKGNNILSTLPGNKYGLMQGTSMACPHVSGVAALIVSKLGGSGFTPTALRNKLNSGATNISSFNPAYPIGIGLVNAYRSIVGGTGKAPDKPSNLSVSSTSNNISFSVTVPGDEDDGLPVSIFVYYSKSDFSSAGQTEFAQFYIGDLTAGDTLEGTIFGLEFNTNYYVAAAANDLAGNKSALTSRVQIQTKGNNPPILNALGDFAGVERPSVSLKAHESVSIDFEAIEPDQHFYFIELEGAGAGLVLDTLTRNLPKVKILGPKTPTGSYTTKLVLTDEHGLSCYKEIDYRILENHAPRVSKQFEDMIFGSRAAGTQEYDVDEYFTDEDGEKLSYRISIDNESVINLTQNGDKFYLTPMSYGYATISVTGIDVRNEEANQSFRVLVRDGSTNFDVYPNPVRAKLHIRGSEDGEVNIKIISASGKIFYQGKQGISAFEPGIVDMTKASPGQYTVFVEQDGKENKYYIVKL